VGTYFIILYAEVQTASTGVNTFYSTSMGISESPIVQSGLGFTGYSIPTSKANANNPTVPFPYTLNSLFIESKGTTYYGNISIRQSGGGTMFMNPKMSYVQYTRLA
jgi:hypothetical protein